MEDYDYTLRIRRAGFRILADGDAMARRRREAGRIGLAPRRLPRVEPQHWVRHYYSTRNHVFLMRSTFGRPDLARREAVRSVLRCAATWLRGPRHGFGWGRHVLRGLWDGYRGRLGRTLPLGSEKGL
jgi:hypothetical protein